MTEFQTIDPARNEVLKTYKHLNAKEIDEALSYLNEGFRQPEPLIKRERMLVDLAQALRNSKEDLARLITREMGKPLADSRAEVEKSATAADYMAEHLQDFLATETTTTDRGAHFAVLPQATGPLLAIMPWNFPIWQTMRILPASIGLGNPMALKHSDQVAGTAELFSRIVQSVTGPRFFQNLRIDHEQAARVIADPRIRSITMTGSSRGGREVASTAGQHLKKVVLELGGSDPYLVFEDADLNAAAKICAQTRLINNGQSCISGKRFLVAAKIYDRFLEIFTRELASPAIGDPMQEDTKIGPLAHLRFQKSLQRQTEELAREGAEKIFERELRLDADLRKGAFFAPQVWRVTGKERMVREEEFFGPVALVMRFENEGEAIELANASVYGLGAGVFSQDVKRLRRVAEQLQCGFVALNDFVRSDPHVPFGGVKDSGFGRELGPHGFREFVNFKTLSGL